MTYGRRAGDSAVGSEFDAIMEMLRQQRDHMDDHFTNFKSEANSRFDRVEVRLDRVETRLTGVEAQVAKTNGTVTKHTEQIASFSLPDRAPLLTKAEGSFAYKMLFGASIVFGGAAAIAQWVLTNWGHVLPILTGAVSR